MNDEKLNTFDGPVPKTKNIKHARKANFFAPAPEISEQPVCCTEENSNDVSLDEGNNMMQLLTKDKAGELERHNSNVQ